VLGYSAKEPDVDDSWIGQALGAEDARHLAESSGFELRYQYGAGTQYYWLWFFKK
jgi:hypothetical protein